MNLNEIREPKSSDNNKREAAVAATKKMASIRCFFCKSIGHPKKECFAFKRSQAINRAVMRGPGTARTAGS